MIAFDMTIVEELSRELAHVRAELDVADRACARLEKEVEELREQLALVDADNAELILRCRKLQESQHTEPSTVRGEFDEMS